MLKSLPSLIRALAMLPFQRLPSRAVRTIPLCIVSALLLAVPATDAAGQNRISVDLNGNLLDIIDFDDLHTFNIFFTDLTSDESDGSGAIDALEVIWIGEASEGGPAESSTYTIPQAAEALLMRNWQKSGFVGGSLRQDFADEHNRVVPFNEEFSTIESSIADRIGIVYGIGVIASGQQFQVSAKSAIIESNWTAGVDNRIFGPKTGVIWQGRRGKWTFDAQGLLMLGFNAGQVSETTSLGAQLIPGALNRTVYGRPEQFAYENSHVSFSPTGELRMQSTLKLTKAVSLYTGWSSLMVGNFLEVRGAQAEPSTMTILDVNGENLILHHLFCGVEFVL